MVHVVEEPLLQKKRRFLNQSGTSLNNLNLDPNQDDFFIIGPSDEFNTGIPYRNRLRYRPKSTSPTRNAEKPRLQAKKPLALKIEERPKTAEPRRRKNSVKPVLRRENHAIQTEGARKALEDEINRIRRDIENRKQVLRKENQPGITNAKQVVYKPGQNPNNREQRRDDLRLQITTNKDEAVQWDPKAPRKEKQGQRRPSVYVQQKPLGGKTADRKSSPIRDTFLRQTEYQSAFKAPDSIYFRCRMRPGRSTSANNADLSNKNAYPVAYDTEYQHEYKPFKYVSEDQLRSGMTDDGRRINVVPLRRPRSAYYIDQRLKGTNKQNESRPERRARTPSPKRSTPIGAKKRRYTTEYAAQYRGYLNSDDNKPQNRRQEQDWLEELGRIHQRAEEYRQRDHSSHFVREHLAQLGSDCVEYWDPPSSGRCEKNYEKTRLILSMPPAGIPSFQTSSGPNATPNTGSDRHIVYDSDHVRRALDDQWSSSSLESSDTGSDQAPRKLANEYYPSRDRRTASIFPQGNGTTPGTYQSPTFNGSPGSNYDTTQITSDEDSDEPSVRPGKNYDYRRVARMDYPSFNKPTDSSSLVSPLSVRSMVSSASMASETLERARKQRDRIFNEYEGQRQRPTYSPRSYTSPLIYPEKMRETDRYLESM